jgi:hypothetical protein
VARKLTALVVALALGAGATGILTGPGTDADPGESSTLRATYHDRDGDGVLERAPAESLRDRTQLSPAVRPGRTLAVLAQLTDAHVRDEESPGRATLLDRLGKPFTSTFRPQEALSTQTLAASVDAVERLDPDATLVTGDLIDSAQANELDQALAVLEGGRVAPDSGGPGYDGPQDAASADPFLYRPDVDAPRHPGLLEQAQRPFTARGLSSPWYPTIGNHDLLVQGEAAPTPALKRLVVGPRTPAELDPGLRPQGDIDEVADVALGPLLDRALAGPTRAVAPDPRRRHLTPSELLERLRAATGAGSVGGRLDYSFDVGARLRVIVLDLTRRDGGSRGRVAPGQPAWLEDQLDRAGERWVLVASHQPIAGSAGGTRLLDALDRAPRVVAVLSGHTHESSIEPRRSATGGYWLIGTPSLADYPQQARALRLRETAGGGVVVETWMLDTAPGQLADISRDLAFLDAQGGRPQGARGAAEDRNVRLYRGPPS